jgi:hypothetical protein
MGKPTRNELVAEYYLRAAGVAAVWIDAEGHVGAQDVASVENEPGRVIYCCERGSHFVLAYRLYEWKKSVIVDPPVIAAKLEELAESGLCESVESLRKPASERSSGPPSGIQKRGHACVDGWLVAWGIAELETEMSRSSDWPQGLASERRNRPETRTPRTPLSRISPKVIFCWWVRAGTAHDSADRASREAATAWACSAQAHKARGAAVDAFRHRPGITNGRRYRRGGNESP